MKYIALHSNDAYWSGEKMLEAQDRFKIFLYIKDDDLAGYIDVSTGSGVNEVFDVLVSSECRRQGIGGLLFDFEYNTYIRDFFEDNKDRSLSEAIICWKYKKSLRGHNRYERSDLNALKQN